MTAGAPNRKQPYLIVATGRAKRVRRPSQRRSRLGVLVRVAIVTVAFAALGFALAGLLGITVISIMNAIGAPHNMQAALWAFAMPGAVVGAVVGFAVIVWTERKAEQP